MMMAQSTDQDCIYEVEYTSNGETDLQQRRSKCAKNPQHKGFIPMKTFTQQDLPTGYQSEEMARMVKVIAGLTVRISCSYISMIRRTTMPDTDKAYISAMYRGCSVTRVGTGFITRVVINEEQKASDVRNYCPCFECLHSKFPQLSWGKVSIVTAAHVVCAPDEVVHTEVDCFYDSDDNKDAESVLYGDSMKASSKNPITKMDYKDDFCQFDLITHNIELCRKLNEYRLSDLLTSDLGISAAANSCLTIVVSHPHGCPKCVSFGEWTSQETVKDPDNLEKHKYYYNTPTCSGSSGALVWVLEATLGKWQKIYVHSAGLTNGNGANSSGMVDMFKEFISSQVQCRVS